MGIHEKGCHGGLDARGNPENSIECRSTVRKKSRFIQGAKTAIKEGCTMYGGNLRDDSLEMIHDIERSNHLSKKKMDTIICKYCQKSLFIKKQNGKYIVE